MIDMNELIQRFVLHEGCELKPYHCLAGYLSIGIGRNLETNPLTSEEQKVVGNWQCGITKDAAFFLLKNDIARAKKECESKIPFWQQLDQERQYALLDMTFNLGIKGVLKFKKMLAAMGCGDWEKAAEECLNSKYAAQTGQRAKRIAETIRTGRFKV